MIYERINGCGITWLVNPMPKPSKMRPTINIQTCLARPLMRAPARKSIPPKSMDSFRPNLRVTEDATRHDNSAARYKDDVNIVRIWLSYWQYSLVDVSRFFFRYTDGKNFFKKGSIDVTPPNHNQNKTLRHSHNHKHKTIT